MRLPELFAAALLWQSATLVNIGASATPEHLRFERAVQISGNGSGVACATLDPTVLAHTASAAHNDLRLYRHYPGQLGQLEVPYLLTESGPEPVADATAAIDHLTRRGDTLFFDLLMPARAYSEVELHLLAHDFVGTVEVSGTDARGRRVALGSFGIFDLTTAGLGSWTVLPLAETASPVLHLALRLRTPDGRPLRAPALNLVAGATVPPSRERQTVYTPVSATTVLQQTGSDTMAILHVGAHVPIERVSFTLTPGFTGNFSREVIVRARPDRQPSAETEVIHAGDIQQVHLPSGDPGLNPIAVRVLDLDATLGATLTGSAIVRVLVENGTHPPLPLRSVTLAMRERRVCFLALAGALYTLRYGDPALAAPVYDDTALADATRAPLNARLGPENLNPEWAPRRDTRPFLDRHPELFWIAVLVCAGMMGGTGLHFVQHRGGGVHH